MATVMNMGSYEIEHHDVVVEEYGDEVMCAGWNPQLELVGNRPLARVDRHMAYIPAMTEVDVDTFLQLMYRNQR